MVIVTLLTGLGSSVQASADRKPSRAEKTAQWQQAMQRLRAPGKGCFTASYPKFQWLRAQCKAPPDLPYPPMRGHRPQVVGNGNDFAAEVSSPLMTSATGSFDTTGHPSPGSAGNSVVTGITTSYSLQLNTKPFTTPLCSGRPIGCQGWQQFLYSRNSNKVFIQYWLLTYNTDNMTCPAGWNHYANDCWRNGPTATALSGPALTAADITGLTLTGTAISGGNDTVAMTAPSGNASATVVDSILSLANAWRGVEFTIVGDCCLHQANFSAGTTLYVRTTTHNDTRNAPTCQVEGFTGETNNLNLVGTSPLVVGPSPAIVSKQTYSPGSGAGCSAAAGLGDTHLTTFRNLLYDFQASGDFALAQTGPRFMVQARQVSGAPTWPNASVNHAIATRIGKTDVAVCGSPKRALLKINKRTVNLVNGRQHNLSDGGDVTRYGNVYLIRGKNGDSVRVEVNPGNPYWMNASVGLGLWPETVHGLLASIGKDGSFIVARDGTVLAPPYAFNEFYNHYGKSWRVPASQSLLSVCGGKVERGNPQGLIYSNNLPPKDYKIGLSACLQTRVREGPLLDACTVDVAVLRNKAAAKVYLGLPTNVTWGKITAPLPP
jgi:hypothetical protein